LRVKEKSSSAQVAVTGGAGFIGSHLVEALVNQGYKVRVLDDLSCGRLDNLSSFADSIEFQKGDIRNQKLVSDLLDGAGVVYHLAGMASVPQSLNDPKLCLEVNGQGTLNVFTSAVKCGLKRLVYASSSAVYGDLPSPQTETDAPRPNTPYAAIKLLGEHLGLFYSQTASLTTVSLRYFNVYGPRQSADGADAGVVPIFVKAVSEGRSPIVYGNGLQTRDFIHVRDVVRATMLAAKASDPGDGVFNVATGTEVTLKELLKLLKRFCPKAPDPIYAPVRAGDPLHSGALVDKARYYLGFKASISLPEGLSELFPAPDNCREK
jgi:UDP-glucose 4-epimerase